MPSLHRLILCGGVAAGGLFGSGTLPAFAQSEAGPAASAYNSAFLVQASGQTYYASTLARLGTSPDGEWSGALDIYPAEDHYQFTHATSDRNTVSSLLNSLSYFNAPNSRFGNWQTDGWNDNLAWMVNAFLRGYVLIGTPSYLTQAEAGWNNGYSHWDTTDGGGIWENDNKPSKCALSNDPFVFEGVELYQATGNASYLTKAEAIYNWVRTTLFNATSSSNARGAPGQVNGCVKADGSLESSSNVYDSGSFIEAAATLYKVTGNATYSNDAQLAIAYVVNKGSIIPYGGGESGHAWEYWFFRGLSDFATEAGLWSKYGSYFQNNAAAAWNARDGANITWNDWSATTDDSDPDPNEMSSAASIQQELPPSAPSLSGTFEIESTASGLALNVDGASTANAAAVIQYPFSSGQANALWTFVPTSGGYYQIKNVNSGKVLNVDGASAMKGASIVQWPAQSVIPGNDQWMPVHNPNGTWSFYNLDSQQALDVPGGSTQVGLQMDQWFGNSTSAQEWTLVSR